MKWRGRGKQRLPELERRKRATEATLARYKDKAFDWGTGVTCVHLARFHLRNMGHRPPSLPRFRSALGAKKAMRERGWDSVTAMMDSMLPRIAPAAMRLGDLAAMEGEGGLDGILVCAGPRRWFGWCEGEEKPVMIEAPFEQITAAWRA